MNDQVKVALILAAAILTAIALYLYFSPYQQCVRAVHAHDAVNVDQAFSHPIPELWCRGAGYNSN